MSHVLFDYRGAQRENQVSNIETRSEFAVRADFPLPPKVTGWTNGKIAHSIL
jgi:hypothetical protein